MKIKVMYEGKQIEVDAPEGMVTSEQLAKEYVPRSYFEHEVARKARSQAKKEIDALKSDETKRAALLKELGVEPAAPGKGGDPADLQERLKQAQAAWERDNLAPEREKTGKLSKRVEKLLRSKLERDILAAAAEVGIRKEYLTPILPGQPAPFVQTVQEIFGFSDEHDEHFVRNGDDFMYSSDPSSARVPFKTVAEYITKDFVKTPHAKLFLEPQGQGGAGLRQPSGGAGGGAIRLSREDAKDPQKYRAAKAQAAEKGVPFEVAE